MDDVNSTKQKEIKECPSVIFENTLLPSSSIFLNKGLNIFLTTNNENSPLSLCGA